MNRPDGARPEAPGWELSLLPALLWILGWFALKFVLPAFPDLLEQFGTDKAALQVSIIAFLACYSLTQPLWGSLSERHGRKPVLLVSLGVCMVGTGVVLFSGNMPTYLVGRCLEGVGAGAISPVCRALFVDTYDRATLARKMAVISSVVALMPTVGPLLAGYLVHTLGWKSVFALFLGMTLALFLLTLRRLPETLPDRRRPSVGDLLHQYREVLASRTFWIPTLLYALLTGGLIAYYAATPFWYVFQYGYSETVFSYFALVTALFYIAGTLSSRRFLRKRSLEAVDRIGLWFLFGLCAFLAALTLLPASVYTLVTSASLYGWVAGWMMPASSAAAMTAHPKAAGTASAVLTLSIFGLSSLLSALTMRIAAHQLWQVNLYFGTLLLLAALLALRLQLRPRAGPQAA